MRDTIQLPYLDIGERAAFAMMRLSQDEYNAKRHELVDRIYANEHIDPADTPAAWAGAPLTRWCWLVLHINQLDHDPNVQQPLTHWGIDVSFASRGVRQFLFAIA